MEKKRTSAEVYSEHIKKCASDRGMTMQEYYDWIVKQVILDEACERAKKKTDGVTYLLAMDREAEVVLMMSEDPGVIGAGFDRMQISGWWMLKKINLWK